MSSSIRTSNFVVFSNPQELGKYVSQQLVQAIQQKPQLVLGLATGSTMLPVYAEFVRLVQDQQVDLSALTTFNLDEYIGLAPEHPQSYHYFMHRYLFRHLPLQPAQCLLPKGQVADLTAECRDYSARLQQQGLDIQLLGIGSNGHIGFNEPGTSFASRTQVVELTPETRQDNSRFFASLAEMPTHAVSMGLADIMSAKQVWLLATGQHKAEIMARLFQSQVAENLPASVLKQHPGVQILLDAAAASLIPEQGLIRL